MEFEVALPDEAFNHSYIKDLIHIIQDICSMANVSHNNTSQYFLLPWFRTLSLAVWNTISANKGD